MDPMINFDNARYVPKSQAMINRPNFSRLRIFAVLLAVQISTSVIFAEVEIKSVYHQFMEARSFQRLSEFFSGKENQGRRLIARTQPDARDGRYFVITLNQSVRSLPENSQIKIEIFTNESALGKEFILPLPSRAPKTREIFAGVTGGDWPDKGTQILAWRLTLQNAEGNTIAAKESFLWGTR